MGHVIARKANCMSSKISVDYAWTRCTDILTFYLIINHNGQCKPLIASKEEQTSWNHKKGHTTLNGKENKICKCLDSLVGQCILKLSAKYISFHTTTT